MVHQVRGGDEVVSITELAAEMFELGGLRKRPVAPDTRDLRYKLLRPFKKALAGHPDVAEINRLVECVPGIGLRLNLAGPAQVTTMSEDTS